MVLACVWRASSTFAKRGVHGSATCGVGYARSDGWWVREWKQHPSPKNEEERRRSAEKYGLLPDDYKFYPETVEATGDYPDLGGVTIDHKDPFDNWSEPAFKRNFGEPVAWDHYQHGRPDRLAWTGLEQEQNDPKRLLPRVAIFYGIVVFVMLYVYKGNAPRYLNPVMPKAYPYDFGRAFPHDDPRQYPVVNYSFELEDE